MASVEMTEGLDDLRKNRLAYFKTLNKDNNKSTPIESKPTGMMVPDAICKDVSEKERNNNIRSPEADQSCAVHQDNFELTKNPGTKSNQELNISVLKHKVQNGSSAMATETKQSIDPKTTTFYMLHETTNKNSTPLVDSDYKESSVKTSLKNFPMEKTVKADGLDAYNETVERLIRATKEELLGMKSTDDIWSKIKQENFQSLTVTDKVSTPLHTVVENENEVKTQNDFSHVRSLKENTDYLYDKSEKQKRSENPHNMSSFNSQYLKPELSNAEPLCHKKDNMHSDSEIKKSVTSTKVEEIFSSRQYPRPPYVTTAQDSQDLEILKEETVQQSQDFLELGLATHRPESDRKDELQVEADDLNLGDTVTKELRTVLGEEKFKEFLAKAKRDIDDLHERSSDCSARSSRKDKTPRLIKDRVVEKASSATKHSREVIATKAEKESIHTKDLESKQTRSTYNNETLVSKSRSNTPDTHSIEQLISEYVLDKSQGRKYSLSDSKENVENKLTNSFENKVKDSVDSKSVSNQQIIPKLDLEEVNKHEPHRPKLNRPKHEPLSLYQESVSEDVKEAPERINSGDSRLRQSNYEQVTVPRNVAFSSDEIYNQAYGPTFHGQSPLMSQQYVQGNVSQSGQYGNMQYMSYSIPHTPTTPVSQQHFFRTTSYDSSIPMNFEAADPYRQVPMRQLSYPGDEQPMPHPPVHTNQGIQVKSSSFQQIYSSPEMFVGSPSRFTGNGQAVRAISPTHIPHPPASSAAVPQSSEFFQPHVSSPFSSAYRMSAGSSFQHKPNVAPIPHPPRSSAELYGSNYGIPFEASAPVFSTAPVTFPVSMATQTVFERAQLSPIPQTPTTFNAEVQTDRDVVSPEATDKGRLFIFFTLY